MIPEEQVQDYLSRSGDTELSDARTEVNDHGFCIWGIKNDSVVLVQVYGDGEYWNNWATDTARELGKTSIMFATKRKPDAFIRKYNYELTGYILKREV